MADDRIDLARAAIVYWAARARLAEQGHTSTTLTEETVYALTGMRGDEDLAKVANRLTERYNRKGWLWTFGAAGWTLCREVPGGMDAVRAVFGAWAEATGRRRVKLTPDRVRVIRARLREGYSSEDLQAAVKALAGSAFHRGDNDNGRRYDDVVHALRNAATVDRWLEPPADEGDDPFSLAMTEAGRRQQRGRE